MDLRLNNKVIVVTGSTRGPAEDIIRILIEEGAKLAIIGKNVQEVYQPARESEYPDGKMILIEAELKDTAACKNAIQTIIQKFGRIDGLVNNAVVHEGLARDNQGSFLEILQINLVNYYLATHFALPYLIKSKGAIINISAEIEYTGHDTEDLAATGGGINALTREWAVELLKYGIRVNNIIITGSATEIACPVAFLLSEKSSHTTGQLIRVSNEYILK